MRAGTITPVPPGAATEVGYAIDRARVERAYERMRALTTRPHTPAEARDAAGGLTDALCGATATVTRVLRAAASSGRQVRPPRPRVRRRQAGRVVPPGTGWWSAELVRLAEIGVWLRRTTMDELGVHVPAGVRVAGYAASGPQVSGLRVEREDRAAGGSPREPRIGVDLWAVVDSTDRPAGAPVPTEPAETAAPARVA